MANDPGLDFIDDTNIKHEHHTPEEGASSAEHLESDTSLSSPSKADFVYIRKFHSVNDFMDRVRTLDTVLENIDSFCAEASRINGRKPQ